MEISVVVPTYRRGNQILPTLESALGQDGVDVRVIVIDDASGDATRDEIAALAGPRVRVLEQPENAGPSAARRRATEEATTPLVAYLDDDDRWTASHLRSCVQAMRSAGASWAYGGVRWVDGALQPLHDQPLLPPHDAARGLLAGNATVTPSALVVERELALEAGWDPELRVIGDWDFVLRLVSLAQPAASAEHSVLYVRHDQAMSRSALDNVGAELQRVVARHDGLARSLGTRVGAGQFWRWLAYNAREGGNGGAAARLFLRAAVADRSPVDVARAARSLAARR